MPSYSGEPMFASHRLHWYHWAVVALSLILTLGAWYLSSENAEQRSRTQFNYHSAQIIDLLQERMAKYEEALWASAAALHVKKDYTRDDWRLFSENLHLQQRYPGINGIGVIHYVPPGKLADYLAWQRETYPGFRVHPEHNKDEFWPITYIEPEEANLAAIGLDMAHEVNRYTAALLARSSGRATITGPITLVQDARKTPGFLFFAPWFDSEHSADKFGDDGFFGLVYAPFIVRSLMSGTLENTDRQVHFSIHDGDSLLYSELSAESSYFDADPMFQESTTVEFYGRQWTFQLQSTSLFRSQQSHTQPMVILVGGLIIDALLLAVFVVLGRSRQQAIDYAEQATENLRQRQIELERTQMNLMNRNSELLEANRELDQFAFVASHDLKAPLRGVGQLAGWIQEDLEGQLSEETDHFLDLLKGRIKRLEVLLDGLLGYSRIGRVTGLMETFEFRQRIEELYSLQSPPDGFRLVCQADFDTMTTAAAPFDQVVRNLVANAFKHHDKDSGIVTVTGKRLVSGRYEVSVCDDGPGIPSQHQESVFDLFHTLKPRDDVEGSGLGLSIVKKIVEKYSGSIGIHSTGRGTCFVFDWPADSYFVDRSETDHQNSAKEDGALL